MAYIKVKDRRRFERKEFRDYIKLSDDKVLVQVEDTQHYWDTEDEAFQEYKLFKESEIRILALRYRDRIPDRLFDALIKYEVRPYSPYES